MNENDTEFYACSYLFVHSCSRLSIRHSNESLAENIHTHARTHVYAPSASGNQGEKDLIQMEFFILVGVQTRRNKCDSKKDKLLRALPPAKQNVIQKTLTQIGRTLLY